MKKIILFTLLITLSVLSAAGQTAQKWHFTTGGRIYSSPLIAGDLILFGSGDSCFYALDKTDGKEIWRFKSGGAVNCDAAICESAVLFASADGYLYSLDVNTGRLNWKAATGKEKMLDLWDYYLSSPVVSGGLVFRGSSDSCLYALEAGTGNLKWKFRAGGMIHATPVIEKNAVMFGDFAGNFYALNAADGSLLWQFKTVGDLYFPNGEVQKGGTIGGETVYFGSRDFNVYALNTKTGRGKWNMKERGSWVVATPVIYGEHIYFGTSDTHSFYCLRKSDGEVIWKIRLPMRVYGSAIVCNDVVYFGCFDGKLRGVDPLTGAPVTEFLTQGCKDNYQKVFNDDGSFRSNFELYGRDYVESERIIHTLGAILSTPVADAGVLYFGSSDGNLYAVEVR